MKQRDALIVLGAVMLAVAISAIFLASSLATVASAERRVFFDPRSSPPPARTVIETLRGLPVALQPIVPVQRGLTDTARDGAGYLLTLLATSAALVLARDQVARIARRSGAGGRNSVSS